MRFVHAAAFCLKLLASEMRLSTLDRIIRIALQNESDRVTAIIFVLMHPILSERQTCCCISSIAPNNIRIWSEMIHTVGYVLMDNVKIWTAASGRTFVRHLIAVAIVLTKEMTWCSVSRPWRTHVCRWMEWSRFRTCMLCSYSDAHL